MALVVLFYGGLVLANELCSQLCSPFSDLGVDGGRKEKRRHPPPLLKRWVNSLAWWIAWVDGQLVITIIGGGGGLGYEDSTQ